MRRKIEAVYEKGVLVPLEDPDLAEHQRVSLEFSLVEETEAVQQLRKWQEVYRGLTPEEVDENEQIAMDRSSFFTAAS